MVAAPAPPSSDALVREALRVNDRYLAEIVVAFNLCPWADRALREGHVTRQVVLDAAPEVAPALAFVDAVEPDPRVEIGLLIFPRLALDALEFNHFAARVRDADRKRRARGTVEGFALAAFHPEPAGAFATPHQLVSFIRSTPDPTFQFVRYTTLDAARGTSPDVSDSIAEKNFETVAAAGRARLEALLHDIRRDRDQAYARVSGK